MFPGVGLKRNKTRKKHDMQRNAIFLLSETYMHTIHSKHTHSQVLKYTGIYIHAQEHWKKKLFGICKFVLHNQRENI